MFKPYPFKVDYDQLLEISGRNQELVDEVRKYIKKAYFDEAGNPKEYGGFERISITLARKREMSIPDKNATDAIHVAFDKGHAVHLIGGPIGDNYVWEFGMNKSFLYSMSKMM
ncbi:hypothetical protein D3C74_408960 [compost metagenome]